MGAAAPAGGGEGRTACARGVAAALRRRLAWHAPCGWVPCLSALFLSTLLFSTLGAAPAAASDGTPGAARQPVAPGCPSDAEWRAQVAERLPDMPGARATLERWAVHIEPVPEGYRGWVGSEAATERLVQGRTCREVFDALVLIAALSLESEEGSPATASDSLASIVVPAEPASPEAAGPADDVTRAGDRGEPHPDDMSVGALGFVQLQTGVAPATALDVGAAVVVAWRAAGFEPWLSLGFYAGSAPQALRIETATARFEHWSTRALGCPWRFPREGPAALRPCLGLDVGRVRGEGARVAGAATRSAPWLGGLAELRLDLEVMAGVSLGVSGGAVVPFVRPRFYFEPAVVAYQAAPVGFAASSFAALLF